MVLELGEEYKEYSKSYNIRLIAIGKDFDTAIKKGMIKYEIFA